MHSMRDDPWWQLPAKDVELYTQVEQFKYGDSDSDIDCREEEATWSTDRGQEWLQEGSSSSSPALPAEVIHDRTTRITSLLSAAEVLPDEVAREQLESEPGLDEARIQSSHREPRTQEAKRQLNS